MKLNNRQLSESYDLLRLANDSELCLSNYNWEPMSPHGFQVTELGGPLNQSKLLYFPVNLTKIAEPNARCLEDILNDYKLKRAADYLPNKHRVIIPVAEISQPFEFLPVLKHMITLIIDSIDGVMTPYLIDSNSFSIIGSEI